MGWLSKLTSRTDTPDVHLTMLTRKDADHLRSLVHRHLAQRGFEPDVGPDFATIADGTTFGLWNLGANAAGDPDGRRGWPSLVADHLDSVIEAVHQPEDLTDELLAEHLLVRLIDTQTSGSEELARYAPEWMPGVLRILVVDLPRSVRTVSPEDAEGLAPLGPLYDRGLANLAREFAAAEFEVETLSHEGGSFQLALSEWVYTSSLPLLLPQAVDRFAPGADLGLGVLFCVPNRHQFAFHVCRDAEDAARALTIMPTFAINGYADGVSPLSPHTYLWLDGQVDQLTEITDTTLSVPPGPHLDRLFAQWD